MARPKNHDPVAKYLRSQGYLSTPEAAEAVGLDRQRVGDWCRRKKVQSEFVNGNYYVHLETLKKFIAAETKVEPASEGDSDEWTLPELRKLIRDVVRSELQHFWTHPSFKTALLEVIREALNEPAEKP